MFITLTAFKIKVKQSTMLNSSGGYDFGWYVIKSEILYHLSIYLSINQSIYLSIYLSTYRFESVDCFLKTLDQHA